MKNLASVEKPVRYIGSEWNAVHKDPQGKLRFAFVYPDVYEVGMSFLGLQLLYGLLNKEETIWCERAFAPWPDREAQLRQEKKRLCVLESGTPLHEMNIIGFALQHEMLYTNILSVLDLGGISIIAEQRRDDDPIVIAGGPCAYNPMPLVDFMDAFAIGEGEEVILEICGCVKRLRDARAQRSEILCELGKIPGVFVPSLYETVTNRLGETIPLHPKHNGIPERVEKRLIMDFERSYYPEKPIVPNTQVIHHRVALEVMRGCSGGCRFCQAGYTNRPVRERSYERLLRDAKMSLRETGLDELSLLSLSTGDYSRLPDLCYGLIQGFYSQRVALSLPSLRVDNFPSHVIEEIGKVRGTGLTFAPEAGTERLRWAINKLIHDDEILDLVRETVQKKQTVIKLYFMLGLPTETDQDIQGIVDLIHKIKDTLRREGKKRTKIHVGISPFVPKPHTAFQWYGQISLEEMERRVNVIRSGLSDKWIKVNWHDPRKSVVESALARGDVRVGSVIRTVYENGGRFDEWKERFSFERWVDAFASHGLSLEEYASKQYEQDDLLPWKPISARISDHYLWSEWEKTLSASGNRHCGNEFCTLCGVCDGENTMTIHAPSVEPETARSPDTSRRSSEGAQSQTSPFRCRLKFSKTGRLIYLSHLDLMSMFEALFRRAEIPIAFSQGFHPHPKIVFASALPVGVESLGEYLDLYTIEHCDPESLIQRLNRLCPEGLRIIAVCELGAQAKKITAALNAFQFTIHCLIPGAGAPLETIQRLLNHPEWRKDFNLYRSYVAGIKNGCKIQYTCAVSGGKYTKADSLVARLQDAIGCSIEITGLTRDETYQLDGNGNLAPFL